MGGPTMQDAISNEALTVAKAAHQLLHVFVRRRVGLLLGGQPLPPGGPLRRPGLAGLPRSQLLVVVGVGGVALAGKGRVERGKLEV